MSLQLGEAQNLNSQVFLSLPCGPGGGGGRSDRKILVLEFWEAQNLNSQVLAFCHSHASLGGGPGSDRKTLVLELWEAQNLNSLVTPTRAWEGGFWSFERPKTSILRPFCHFSLGPKTSILRSFCHSHAGLGWGGGGGRAVTAWFWRFGRPKTSILRSFLSPPCGPGGEKGRAGGPKPQFSGLFVTPMRVGGGGVQ